MRGARRLSTASPTVKALLPSFAGGVQDTLEAPAASADQPPAEGAHHG